MLLEPDESYLREKGYVFETAKENSVVHLIIKDFNLPAAYLPRTVDLLIRLPSGYPQGNPDMFWTRPDVTLVVGGSPQAADVKETYLGMPWQRWSRHWGGGWRAGIDGLQTVLAAIIRELQQGR